LIAHFVHHPRRANRVVLNEKWRIDDGKKGGVRNKAGVHDVMMPGF
jgi:hypothetical protein